MEWRQQTTVSCAHAFNEAQRWIEEVTGKSFGCNDFRAALANGVLLCDLINQLKPGIIKRVNRRSTPIAGLDNVNVFLTGCEKLGLNDSQLFHPGDLQDLSTRATLRRDESSRRLKNVLITIYWLGRKAHLDTLYSGPQLNLKAFEGLLGLALSKALEDGCNLLVRDGGHRECQCAEREESQHFRLRQKREHSTDTQTRRPNSDGLSTGRGSEAQQVLKMESAQQSPHQNNGLIPTSLRSEHSREEKRSTCASPLSRPCQIQVRPERPLQVNPGWIWSKSLSDIPMLYAVRKDSATPVYGEGQPPGLTRQWSEENHRKCSVAAKDTEAHWQDDFTKWKNRRRSTKGDLHMKSQDREHVIKQMTNGAVNNEKNEAQHGLMKRDQQSPRKHSTASQPSATSPPSKSLSSDLRPHTPLTRGYATEAAFSPTAPLSRHNSDHTWGSSLGVMPASDGGNILGEETHFTSFASDGARIAAPSLDCHVRDQDKPTSEVTKPGNVFISQISTFITTLRPNEIPKATSNRKSTLLLSSRETRCVDSTVETCDVCPDAANCSGVKAVDDSPRQNRSKFPEESEMSCFDPAAVDSKTQQAASVSKYMTRSCPWSGSASLPRGYRRSDSSSRLSSAITARPFVTKQSRMSSLPRQCSVDDYQGRLSNTEKDDSSHINSAPKRQTATVYLQSSARQSSSLPSTLASSQPHLLPQPYLNLQHHHKRILSTPSKGSTDPEKVDRSDMRVSLTLKPNSIADFGFQTHWDSAGARIQSITPGSPAELCRLCANDEIVAVDGVLVADMSFSQWKDEMASALRSGELTMDVRRHGYNDWNARKENHRSQPGRSPMTLNLTAADPTLVGCADHCEAAFRNVSKCNAPADDVIESEVCGELSDDPMTARSKGGSESAISDLQVPSLSPSSTGWSWDREEDRRRQERWQEEQERLLQEQYQRDQERLEAEWQRAQQEAIDGRKSGQRSLEMITDDGGHVSSHLCINGQMKENPELQIPDKEKLKATSNVQAAQSDCNTQNGWADASCGFTPLSNAHRAKSLSTSVLADAHTQTRGDQRKSKGQQLSQAEQDRQQILEEMKKRTQLLTDNSWIRQRSSSFYKEPVYTGVPMKRCESLDDLDTLHRSPSLSTTFGNSRPHSAAAGYCAPSRNSYSRYSTGTIPSQRNTSAESSHNVRGLPLTSWRSTDKTPGSNQTREA